MKQIGSIILMLIIGINSAYAHKLKSFTEIKNSFLSGHNIRLVIDFDRCLPKPAVANVKVYTTPKAVMIKEDYLQFANTSVTTNYPPLPKKAVVENVTYRITQKNDVSIVIRHLSLPNYNIINEFNTVCPLGVAAKVFGKKSKKKMSSEEEVAVAF